MITPIFNYCYYCFDTKTDKHHLRVRVTSCLDLEWSLEINGRIVSHYLDTDINILIEPALTRALSWNNVIIVYNRLLGAANTTT